MNTRLPVPQAQAFVACRKITNDPHTGEIVIIGPVRTQETSLTLVGAFRMSDLQALPEVQKIVKNDRAFLPVACLLAVGMAVLAISYRPDQGPKAFLAGVLTGGLGAIAVAMYVYSVRLSTALRGEQGSGILRDAHRLASYK